METLGETEIWTFLDNTPDVKKINRATVARKIYGHKVESFMELAKKVAELQFRNPEYVLLFRGQKNDYKNDKGNSTLKPSILRSENGSITPPSGDILTRRFENLKQAQRQLIALYPQCNGKEAAKLTRQRILQWAILQHYEVCDTPLLDVTHSLRIATSFASQNAQEEAFLYALAVPNLSGSITASAEAGLQILRLSSVCPPTAIRPHLQEGYLLGEYPDMGEYDQKLLYPHYEIDFGRRMIAKFCFNPQTFWSHKDFPKITDDALRPSQDTFNTIAEQIKQSLSN